MLCACVYVCVCVRSGLQRLLAEFIKLRQRSQVRLLCGTYSEHSQPCQGDKNCQVCATYILMSLKI